MRSAVTAERKRGDVPLGGALFVLGGVLAILAAGGFLFRVNIVALLAVSGAFTTAVFSVGYGYGLGDLFGRGVLSMITRASGAMAILLSVGPLIATWTMAGTIPYIIHRGLSILTPGTFLVSSFLVCSAASLVTGTSWGTAGTFGVALTGIASGLGIDPAVAAGAIVGGSYFGDKISPVSDSTILTSAVAEVSVVDHIRSMLWTTLPGFFVSLALYGFLGSRYDGAADFAAAESLLSGIEGAFFLNPALLLPPVVLLILSWRRVSPVTALWTSVAVALPFALSQGFSLPEILRAMVAGPDIATGSAAVDDLLGKGGFLVLAGVAVVVSMAYVVAGQLEATGTFRRVSELLTDRFIRGSRGRFVLSVSLTGILIALLTGNTYLCSIIPGTMYAPVADRMNISRRVLSRTLDDSGTAVIPLVPWSAAGVYMSSLLGVPTVSYLPWTFLCYLAFLTGWFYGFSGLAIWPSDRAVRR